MNIYAVAIMITLAAGFLLELIASFLNMKNLKHAIPKELKGLYSEDKLIQSVNYSRVKIRFGIIMSAVNLIVILVFWHSGGFNYIDYAVTRWSDSPIIRGILYIGVLSIFSSLVSLPFNLYSIFVIEEKFGFNKTTFKVFFADMAKTIFLSVIIGGPLLALILWLFITAGEYAWLLGFGAVSIFTFVIQLLYPKIIMPLFNKFRPLENDELNRAIHEYAAKVEFPVQNIYEMDGSKRSSKTNAFFTGFGKYKKVVLFDTLIQKHSIRELISIFAHEVGHYKKKHILWGTVISVIHTGFVFWLLSVFLSHSGLYEAFYMDKMEIYSGLLFFGLLYSPVELVLGLLLNIISRKNEFEADKFAAETTNDPESMISALKKIGRAHV